MNGDIFEYRDKLSQNEEIFKWSKCKHRIAQTLNQPLLVGIVLLKRNWNFS